MIAAMPLEPGAVHEIDTPQRFVIPMKKGQA
jgi:hypothetical protein